MSRKVSPRPKGFRTVTPVLTVAGAAGAVEFYASVFGAEEGARIYREDGVSVAHSELKIGDSQLIVCDENPYFGIHAPTTIGASPVVVHLYLTDIDATWERAVEAGATGAMVALLIAIVRKSMSFRMRAISGTDTRMV